MEQIFISDCETPVAGFSGARTLWLAPDRTLVIQNQEFAENVRRALLMICCPLKLRQW